MTDYFEIAVNVPRVSGTYHYHLPVELEGRVQAGCLVEVPFGKQVAQGIVLRQATRPGVAETRAVTALIDPQPVLTPAQLALAVELAESTLSPLAAILEMMLPAGLSQQAEARYALAAAQPPLVRQADAPLADQLVELLIKRGPLRVRQINHLLPGAEWRPAAEALARKGVLASELVLPPPDVHARRVRTAQLACAPAQAEAALPDLGSGKALARRQVMLRFILRQPEPVNVSWVYAESGGKLDDLRFLVERGLIVLGETEIWRDPLEKLDVAVSNAWQLTPAQEAAWGEIARGLQAAAQGQSQPPYLLHGVTGSGKTEIYLRAITETLRLGRQAILLVPEIALTPQTVRRVLSRFPGQVGLWHSGLSDGERYDTWRRARQGLIQVLVGPRSALFAPFAQLGLIVVDECHDDSYYQAVPPFYHTRSAAAAYARLAGAVCVMGSATPDVVTRWQAARGRMQYLGLPERIQGAAQSAESASLAGELPEVQVVDMRLELKAHHTHIFSRPLQAALAETLHEGQQAILFLNRRGMATFIFCRECGHTVKCPQCELPLTLHVEAGENMLVCHTCGRRSPQPALCPECRGTKIRPYGAGTEKVDAEVQALFPSARTLRWDYDTTRQKNAHENILSHFANHRADILIGTQMIAKGLDLPLITLVGVVLADVGLSLPDPRSAERTFQVLTQVAGRAGRSTLGGKVILQTFQPDHYAIQAAAKQDYDLFYRLELESRRALAYPPFGRLARLEMRGRDAARVEAAAQKLAGQIRQWIAAEDRRATQMIGPAPCFFARAGELYRWQIVLRGPDPLSLLRGKSLGGWRVEVDPMSLL